MARITVILVAVLYIGQQIGGWIFAREQISYMGHIVGGMVGAVSGYLLNMNRATRF